MCVCVCVCVCVYVYIYVYMCKCIYIYLCIHIHIHTYMYVCVYVCMHMYMNLMICVYISILSMYACMQVYVCICMCVYIYIYALSPIITARRRSDRPELTLRIGTRGLAILDAPTQRRLMRVSSLHVEYAERGNAYGILFIFSVLCEYARLEYVRIHVVYRVNQAEYGIHILEVAPPEYVNIYSTRRVSKTISIHATRPLRTSDSLRRRSPAGGHSASCSLSASRTHSVVTVCHLHRRIYPRGFRGLAFGVISALGYAQI